MKEVPTTPGTTLAPVDAAWLRSSCGSENGTSAQREAADAAQKQGAVVVHAASAAVRGGSAGGRVQTLKAFICQEKQERKKDERREQATTGHMYTIRRLSRW